MTNKAIFIASISMLVINTSCKVTTTGDQSLKTIPVADSAKGTFWDHTLPTDERIDLLIAKLTLEEKVDQMMHNTPAIPRLGIPAYNWWNESLHGVARFGRATVFPQPIGMAATFDKELIHKVSTAISDEARAKFRAAVENNNRNQYGGLTFWTPNINIFRDPRWGRGMETWGEDPYLTGILASAFVKGLQGNDTTYLKAAACAKHYAVHNGPEGARHYFNALPTRKDLHETYLPAFEMLVREANVEAVMCAYTRLYDEPCCGSDFLLVDILRDQWGFDGHVMSDCGAIGDFHNHHKVTENAAESAALAIKSQVNLNCGGAFNHLPKAIEKGLITEEDIDRNLKDLLRTRFKLGLFDPPGLNPYDQISKEVVNCKEHVELARETAVKSVVMLKNNGVLPLAKNMKEIFVIGPNAASVDAMLGNYNGLSDNIVTIIEGITNKVDLGTRLEYRHGFLLDRDNLNKIGWAIMEAQNADATIVVMGVNTLLEGEEGEAIASPTKSDRFDIQLPGQQLKYLKRIRENDGKPLIVVLTGGSPIAIPEVHDIADAILYAWYPGEQGGNAVADIIFGDASPSGKLPITFPKSVDQLPAYDDYTMLGRTYKYMEKEPLYPFGFGLSYAKFNYSNPETDKKTYQEGEEIKLSCEVANESDLAANEVIQVYVSAPAADFPVPIYDLKAFSNHHFQSKETKNIEFVIPVKTLESINNDGKNVLTKGDYIIYVGGSLPSALSNKLGAPEPGKTVVSIN